MKTPKQDLIFKLYLEMDDYFHGFDHMSDDTTEVEALIVEFRQSLSNLIDWNE